MGWLYTHKQKGESIIDFMTTSGALRWGDDCPAKYTVLASALIGMKTLYAAVERVDKATGERIVWAAVILINYAPTEYHNFGYKDMDESMGPCEDDCPEKILKLLTPTEHHYAIEWRNRCWAKIKARQERPAIEPGVEFDYGGRRYKVTEKMGRKGCRIVDEHGNPYRISLAKLRAASNFKAPGAAHAE